MTKDVALKRCEEYNEDSILKAIEELFNEVPPPDVKGKVVLLKPNILSPKKVEAAVCTHPVVVGAVVRAFVELGAAKVMVGESPATANSTMAAKTVGMYDAVKRNGGEWADFSGSVEVSIPDGKLIKSIKFADAFEKADVIVSLSKLKTHQLMAYTGAMKNLFGLVVGLQKAQMHYRFPDKKDFAVYLTDLNIAAKPQYAIMDAITAMEGSGGPGNGTPVNLNFLAASDNLLALDWVCSSLVGYNPHSILNLEDALSRKIWLDNPNDIKLRGDSVEELKLPNFKIVQETALAITLRRMIPKWLDNIARLVFVRNPHFSKITCIRCGRCIEICPAKILKFSNEGTAKKQKYVVIDRSKCLHCFCCHEICPANAIKLY